MLVLIGIGLAAGFITAISPCVLPVLPIVFAGGAMGGTRRPFAIVAGLIASFTAFTLFGVWLLRRLGLPQDILRNLAIALLFLVAATLLFPRFEEIVQRPLLRLTRKPGGELGGGFLLGASLGLVFVPCAGPVLAAITVVGATQDVGARSIVLTLSYAIGAAVPMLLVAFFGRASTNALRPHAHRIRQVLGVVVGVTALAIAFNVDRHFQTAIPGYTEALQKKVEQNERAQSELRKLTREHPGAGEQFVLEGLRRRARADRALTLDQQRSADPEEAPRKGRPRRLLDVLVHQLPADAAAREGLVPARTATAGSSSSGSTRPSSPSSTCRTTSRAPCTGSGSSIRSRSTTTTARGTHSRTSTGPRST